MALRGVLDANVLASGLHSSRGPGSFLITAARVARFDLVVSQYLLDEVQDTLVADFHRSPEEVVQLLSLIDRISEHLEPSHIVPRCRDPRDDPILALAEEADAAFLATYDHALLAVRSVGSCGVIHPQTAVELVTAAAAEESAEGIPGVSSEDRSKWRYEDNGPPLHAAIRFFEWARRLPAALEAGADITTTASWPRWRAAAVSGQLAQWMSVPRGLSLKVRYPADGIAYVTCPLTHPEQSESFVISGPTALPADIVTILDEQGEWRVHSVGEMVPPSSLGRTAYSW